MRDYILPTQIYSGSHIASPEERANIPFTPIALLPIKCDAEMYKPSSACFIAFCVGNSVADAIKDYSTGMVAETFSQYLDDIQIPGNENLVGVIFGSSVIRWPSLNEFAVCAVVFQWLGSMYRPVYQCGKDFTPKL